MRRTRRSLARLLAPHLLTLAAVAFCLSAGSSARASLPGGKVPGPELVSPAPDVTVQESGLRFAWRPAASSSRSLILISREPFDTRGWTRMPEDPAIEVHALAHPVASLEDLGVRLDADTRLYWAAASEDPATGRVEFSDVRSCLALRKFSNAIEPSPYLKQLPISTARPEPGAEPDRIRLASGYVIDPKQGEPTIPEGLRGTSIESNATRTYLVYFGDADPEAARQHILESGGTVVGYLPDHAYLVRGGASARITLDSGGWVGDYQPAYKLSPDLDLEAIQPATISALVFSDGDLDAVAEAARAAGGLVLVTSSNGINKLIRVSGNGAVIGALGQHPDVEWIEPYVRPTLDNANAEWVIQTGATNNRRVWTQGIMGEGQVVMTSDSGVGTTHDQFRDPSLTISTFGDYPTHRKIIAYKLGSNDPLVEFGDHSAASYHGTHTACTLVGSDDGINSSANDGMAKAAKLYFMDISGTALANGVDPFADLNDLFLPPYQGNTGGAARISSNSWGAANAGVYDVMSLAVDQFMWNHPDFLIVFANGNSGSPGSVGSPATAKDCVSAGGTGNASSENSIYASTSRGPTKDRRLKPTVCAPGNLVTSATTPLSGYATYSGTSMATPCVAGAATLLRQYLTDGWYPTGTKIPANGFTPSAALLKSMLVNSGANMITGYSAPDSNIGFGRVNADSVLYFSGDARRLLLVDYTSGLGNQQAIEYQVNVTDGTIPLEVTLCWTDYPGNPLVLKQLVNDLDLTVTNGSVTYRGNNYTTGFSNTSTTVDHRNVEEAVRIAAPATGLWTIRIDASTVPFGPQPFGLTITGGIGTTAGALALDRASYGSASTVQLRVTDTNAAPTVTVHVTSGSEPAGEDVTLAGSNGILTGSLALSPFMGTTGDGKLRVSNGDLINATYVDASPVATLNASAQVSFTAPIITNVATANQASGSVLVTWNTDANASSRVYYGETPALGSSTPLDPVAAFQHQVPITGLDLGQTYYYDVESQDLNGNLTRDDNGGAHYQFTVGSSADVLLVFSGTSLDRVSRYADALARFGWTYDIWEGPLTENPVLGDKLAGLRSYKAVWWQVGLDYYPPFTDATLTTLTNYMNGGGRMAVTGNDIAWSYGDAVGSPYYSAARQAWLSSTLHTTFVADPAGWISVGGIGGDPISNAYVAGVPYTEHRSGASGDEISAVPGSGTASTDWMSGDGTPDVCGFRWESSGPLGDPDTALWGGTVSRLATMYFEWTGINAASSTDTTRARILDNTLLWLIGRPRPTVAVTAPNGGEVFSGDNTSITWTEAAGGGASVAARTIEYSLNGGQAWTPLTTSAGASPYSWDLTSVPNTTAALVRVRITDDGSPPFTRGDASNAVFTIQRAGGDLVGPNVIAGSIRVSPNPVDTAVPATLTASISDSLCGGGNVAEAEYSFGDAPAAAGSGIAMAGSFGTRTVAVSASVSTGALAAGTHHFYVRGRDDVGNWGPASALSVVVNNADLLAVEGAPRVLALRQNAPNPVVESTVISFAVPIAMPVELGIYDVLGRQVKRLVSEAVSPGVYSVRWDRSDDAGHPVGPGLYYYRLLAGGRSLERRMVTLR